MKKLTFAPVLALILTALPATVQACNSCMGKPDSNIAPALGASMFGMFALVALLCAGFLRFIFFLAKRDGLPLPEESGSH